MLAIAYGKKHEFNLIDNRMVFYVFKFSIDNVDYMLRVMLSRNNCANVSHFFLVLLEMQCVLFLFIELKQSLFKLP